MLTTNDGVVAELDVLISLTPKPPPCGDQRKEQPTAVQVVKGDQNGYAVLRGIAGPPSSRVYKNGGQALQVGGWATGRQPITVKKKKKANC